MFNGVKLLLPTVHAMEGGREQVVGGTTGVMVRETLGVVGGWREAYAHITAGECQTEKIACSRGCVMSLTRQSFMRATARKRGPHVRETAGYV